VINVQGLLWGSFAIYYAHPAISFKHLIPQPGRDVWPDGSLL